MRADRLLAILLLLQETPRVTASRLAQKLEVSPRTVHRDMEALSMAGIPVYAERGRNGGYALLDTFRAELNHLTGMEIQALFVNNPGILKDLGLQQAGKSGGHKLRRALPELLGRDAARVRRQILVDGAGWRQTAEEHPYLTLLHDALWQARQVRMVYSRADGAVRTRTVHPQGLVAKGRLWYLVALAHEEPGAGAGKRAETDGGKTLAEPRTYRVSRIQQAEVLPEAAVVLPDFDLAAYWAASTRRFVADLPRYPISVWASPRAVERLPSAGWYLQVESFGEIGADGWQHVNLVFHTQEIAISCLAGFGDQITVIEPRTVHDGIQALARAICDQD